MDDSAWVAEYVEKSLRALTAFAADAPAQAGLAEMAAAITASLRRGGKLLVCDSNHAPITLIAATRRNKCNRPE